MTGISSTSGAILIYTYDWQDFPRNALSWRESESYVAAKAFYISIDSLGY